MATSLVNVYWTQLAVTVISVFTLIYLYSIKRYNYWKNKGIPHIPGIFPFGSLQKLLMQKIGIVEQYQEFYNQAEGKYLGLYSFLNQQLLIKDLDLIKDVLVKNFNNFVSRGVYYNESIDPLSAHLFSIDGIQWKTLRGKLSPTFTSGKMKHMYPTVKKCALDLQNYSFRLIRDGKDVIDFKEMTMRYGLDVISTTALGLEGNNFVEKNTDMRRIAMMSTEPTVLQMLRITFALMCKTVAKILRVRFVPKEVENYFLNIVESNTEYRKKNNIKRNDFMQLLIDLKNKDPDCENDTNNKNAENSFNLTTREMAAQTFVFVAAGFETSSVTLGFCLYELALNKEIQEKLLAELDNAGEDISYEVLQQLHYLEMVVCETLRKYPPIPTLQRECSVDYTLPNGEVVDKGTLFVISVIGLHLDPKLFPNPNVFDPERFNKENIRNIAPYSYLPFGEGPRICIGMRFGKMQVKLALVSLLSRFKVEVCDKTVIPIKIEKRTFAYNVEGGVWLRLKERKPVT